ncbi:hypothetical protein [Kitasatospora sp. NPDC089509]
MSVLHDGLVDVAVGQVHVVAEGDEAVAESFGEVAGAFRTKK